MHYSSRARKGGTKRRSSSHPRRWRVVVDGGADKDLPPPPPPPPPARKRTLLCGTLVEHAQFRPDQLDWIRRASPVLHVIDEGTDGGPLPAAAFWEEVAKNFPAKTSLCSLFCRDLGTFYQTMDDWSIDAPPEQFMDMIFGGRSKERKDRQRVLDEAVAGASSPGVAHARRTFRELHFRFAAMMDTWHDRLAEPAMLRAALACPAHPHVDAYVRAKLTKERLAAAARTYDAALNTVKERWRYVYATPAPKLRLVMELMCDAYGTGRLNWLQWMDQNFEIGDEESVLLVSMASVHHSDPMNTACLEWLFAHSRTVARLRRGEPIMWQRIAQTAVHLASEKALRLIEPFRWQRRSELAAWTPIQRVILNGDVARVKLILELGCPQDPKSQTCASATGIPEMIEFCATNTPDPTDAMDPEDLFQETLTNDIGFRRAVIKVHAGYATMLKYGHIWPSSSVASALEACIGFEYQNTMAVPAVYYHGAPLEAISMFMFSMEDVKKHLHSCMWLIAHGFSFSDKDEATLRNNAEYDSDDDDNDDAEALEALDYLVALRNLIRES